MLGSNCNTLCSPPALDNKTCIEIVEWQSRYSELGLRKGSVKYNGKYYVNLITGNTDRPDIGLTKGSYAVGSCDYYDMVKYHYSQACSNVPPQESCDFVEFFSGIECYSNCDESRVFNCGDFIIFENKDTEALELHQSIISNNTRHPHDREAWKNLGDSENILALIFDEAEGRQITLPYWEACHGKNCATIYMKGSCVVERVESGRFDSCGNPIYNELIFQSLEDKNTDRPSLGAIKESPTWDGPYTDCEWFNRPVGFTLNGKDVSPGDSHIIITEGDFCEGTFEFIDVQSSDCVDSCEGQTVKKVCAKSIGETLNGQDINNGDNHVLLSEGDFCESAFELIDVADGTCAENCDENLVRKYCTKPVGHTLNAEEINNGDDHILLSKKDLCESAFEIVSVPDGTCTENCEDVMVDQVCTKPVGHTLNDEPINLGDDHCLLSCDEVAAEEPLVIEDTEIDGHKVKLWKLIYNKGLTVVDGALEALIDTAKGLYFEGDKIAVAIGKALDFSDDGKIDVQHNPDKGIDVENNELVAKVGAGLQFSSTGDIEVVCRELSYYWGNDNGNETVVDQYLYDVSKLDELVGDGLVRIPGGVKATREGIYDVRFTVSAGSNGSGNGLTIVTVLLNGDSDGNNTKIAGISWTLGDNPTGNSYDGDDYHTRGGIVKLSAGDELTLSTVPGFGFAGNIKGSATLWVAERPSHQLVACSANPN